MTIADAPIGGLFTIVKVIIGREIGKRLADMGFTPGAEGEVIRAGFFRGPLHVRIRGYDLLIRRCEAAGIEVEPQGDWSVVPSRPGPGRGSGRNVGRGSAAGAWRGGGRQCRFGGGYSDETGIHRGIA